MAPLLTPEQVELKDSLRSFLAEQVSLSVVRKIFEGEATLRESVWRKLLELGVLPFFAESQATGGGTLRELGMLASEVGYSLCPENLLEAAFSTHLLHALLSPSEQAEIQHRFGAEFQERLSSGALRSSIAISSICVGGGPSLVVEGCTSDTNATTVNVKARFVAGGDSAEVLVAVDLGSNAVWVCDYRKGSSATVQRCPEICLDRIQSLYAVEVRNCPALRLNSLDANIVWLQWAALKSCELSGASRRALEGTVEYLKTRQQFDVPIGGFQAVQHAAADMLVKVEAMHSLADFACWSGVFSVDQLALASRSAALFCAEEAPKVAEKAIQLHGGIGFTWEHDAHLYFKRARAIQTALGTGAWHRERIAQMIGLGASR
ncbi:MAG: acyl-CoA dehydrogenase [Proteobacteria bacterium]|nr:acyl-CoA dehydrogenase [Pseudomonadota bacterium]